MLFLFRSALGIGAVALVASGGGGTSLRTMADGDGRTLARNLGRACIASPDCGRIGMTLVSAATRSTSLLPQAPHPSRDTLQASDLAPDWSGPPVRHTGSTTKSTPPAAGKTI